jgi:hypothetical protein
MEPAATTGVTAGSSEIRPISPIGLVGDIGLEQPRQTAGETVVSLEGDAPDDAPGQLQAVADAWRRLSPAGRRRIIQIIRDELERSATTTDR